MEDNQDRRNNLEEMKPKALPIREKLDSSNPADVQKAMQEYVILVILALALFVVLFSGCVRVQKENLWSYGNFCGKDYPKVQGATPQERIARLQDIQPWEGDDIDAACKQHDICYERHGRNYSLCDLVFMNILNKMKFEGENKAQCENVRIQALYYFLSFRPSGLPDPYQHQLWMTKLRMAPILMGIAPLAVAQSTAGIPNQPCKSIARVLTNISDKPLHLDSPSEGKRAEIVVQGLSMTQVKALFIERIQAKGYKLKQKHDFLAVFSMPFKTELGAIESGCDAPDLYLAFGIMNDDSGAVHIFSTNMSTVVNQDSPFAAVAIDFDVTETDIYQAIQALLDKVKLDMDHP
jgi:hypothetical protein